jgi:hypothetical protein
MTAAMTVVAHLLAAVEVAQVVLVGALLIHPQQETVVLVYLPL